MFVCTRSVVVRPVSTPAGLSTPVPVRNWVASTTSRLSEMSTNAWPRAQSISGCTRVGESSAASAASAAYPPVTPAVEMPFHLSVATVMTRAI